MPGVRRAFREPGEIEHVITTTRMLVDASVGPLGHRKISALFKGAV
jgi:hypothetical protein